MGTYLKLFNNHSQYETFIGGGGDEPFLIPNVSHCIQENHVHYNPVEDDVLTLTYDTSLTNGVLPVSFSSEFVDETQIPYLDIFEDDFTIDGEHYKISELETLEAI